MVIRNYRFQIWKQIYKDVKGSCMNMVPILLEHLLWNGPCVCIWYIYILCLYIICVGYNYIDQYTSRSKDKFHYIYMYPYCVDTYNIIIQHYDYVISHTHHYIALSMLSAFSLVYPIYSKMVQICQCSLCSLGRCGL